MAIALFCAMILLMTLLAKPTNRSRVLLSLLAVTLFLLFVFVTFPVRSAPGLQVTATVIMPAGIFAEAVGEANVRSGPGLEHALIGTIYRGTRYSVIGQDEFVPWVLLQISESQRGWVFADLLSLNVPRTQIPYISGAAVTVMATPTPSPTLTVPNEVVSSPAATMVASIAVAAVSLVADEAINVRFGPGVDYPRIGRLQPGLSYRVISRHTLYPWLLIEFPDAPDRAGWVFQDVVRITGDLASLPVITAEQIGWPTLTPTPPFVVTGVPPWPTSATAPAPKLPGRVDLQALGDTILTYLLGLGFAPEAEHIASVFIENLSSGESISLGRGIAYSGMSLIKIPILVTYYRFASSPVDRVEAELIANTMICSGNHTANALLAILGNGDELAGAQQVTDTMRALGLRDTFLITPFDLRVAGEPTPQPRPVYAPDIDADRTMTAPDPYNETTPEDLGWLLSAIYQCATSESGPLLEVFPDQFTPTECRQMLLAMSRNRVNVLTEAGVPAGIRVAHKHGWIDDTHGDAAIVFTPGGDFVLTMAMYQANWLPYEVSWPTMAEIARFVYNAFNPEAPLEAIHPGEVDETCALEGNPLLAELMSPFVPPFEASVTSGGE